MNNDTKREINQILEDGYYQQGTTLGEGGWDFLYSRGIGQWQEYHLWINEEFAETITAKDDETAKKAFRELFHVPSINSYTIFRVEHTSYIVEQKEG